MWPGGPFLEPFALAGVTRVMLYCYSCFCFLVILTSRTFTGPGYRKGMTQSSNNFEVLLSILYPNRPQFMKIRPFGPRRVFMYYSARKYNVQSCCDFLYTSADTINYFIPCELQNLNSFPGYKCPAYVCLRACSAVPVTQNLLATISVQDLCSKSHNDF